MTGEDGPVSRGQNGNRAVLARHGEGADRQITCLAMIAGAIALDLPQGTLRTVTSRAIEAGATHEEIIGTLITIAPIVGTPRVVAAAPRIAPALGYDIDADFEDLD